MHTCPECGQACYCSGDIDDCPVFADHDGPGWCECRFSVWGCGGEREDDFDDDPPDAGPDEELNPELYDPEE
jgi:hypothetical protein